ncbi:ATP-dependent helicase [Microbacteriaceae bacterium VKM Ac-2854]|nr:ATP-dependent helicase [Microbacteriaceae bacterium VKM Ac-2854]
MSPPKSVLDGLDAGQREAAEALLGPVCILAGAGTGKTRTITHRIAHGVASGVYTPNRVMALTFTARSAGELRNRLRVLGAGGVQARTFHSAALSQLSFFWPQLVGGTTPQLLDGKARLLGHAAERVHLKLDTATLRDLAAEIEWRKVSALSIEQYAARAHGRAMPGTLSVEQTVAMLRAYEELKDERRQIDFEDVLLVTAGMLEAEPAMSMQVREQYRFFVVDEYQDVNPLQQRLLELWLGDRSDLCVVGDASQTIYSFAGARADYLLDFPSRWADASVVRLEENYRSTPEIVATANRLMRGRPGALTLHAERRGDQPAPEPAIDAYADDVAEARGVAERVLADLASGIKAEQIAILYRTNSQSAVLEHALHERGISAHVRGARRFFDLPEVKQAVMQLRAASVSISGEPLFKSVSDVLRGLGWSAEPPTAGGAVRERWDSLDTLMRLVDEAPRGATFKQFTDDLLARQQTQNEPARAAITLATLHSAKGLEWESVHLLGVSEGLLPISYAAGLAGIDEERRLLYVGITRARRRLRLSWSRQAVGRSAQRQPSRFLQEIGSRTPGAAAPRTR